jgi:short-subunit dehydrogenase
MPFACSWQLWFHLPPAAPPLILLASFPRTLITENRKAGISLSEKVVPILSIPFARNLALSGLGLAVMSWAHMELHRKRRLTPLPLSIPYESVSRVFLPPFLPAEVSEPELEALDTEEKSAKSKKATSIESNENNVLSLVGPKIRDRFYDLYESAPRRGIFREWKRVRATRKRESAKIHRLSVFDQLVALQAIKRRQMRRSSSGGIDQSDESPGYALVTGASQGIGRAIAVELARWEIPLVLVARDTDRLISLAYDLEACYGVKCCILSADLAEINAAERIHDTTKKAGITVDILVNNAGVAGDGLSVDMKTSDVERMMMINTMSFAKLSKLYGQDMKRRRRGRILMVSSMSGLTSSSPNCALYGATKSFGKSLALSMAKELEPHGVGVTCLLPGPVTDTQFRDRSGTARALCWSIPFYPKTPKCVAHLGVMALLDGDVQVIPGWQNRVFAKMFRPILPQRVETMCVEAAWSPLCIPRLGIGKQEEEESSEGDLDDADENEQDENVSSSAGIHVPLDLKPRYSFQMPPRLLKLPEPEPSHSTVPEPTSPPDEEESTTKESNDFETSSEQLKVQQGAPRDELPTESQPTEPAIHESEQRVGVVVKGESRDSEQQSAVERKSPTSSISDDGNKGSDAGPGETSKIAPVNKDTEKEKQVDPEETTEQASVGTKLNRKESPWSMRMKGNGEDDDDLGLSPQLGPVDLFQNRKYLLPKAKSQFSKNEDILV